MDRATKEKILKAAKAELLRHSWGTHPHNPPSMAEGGNGAVMPGCQTCKKPANTVTQYMKHLADDVLPVILRAAFKIANEAGSVSSDNYVR
jgi:hypothetical protein